MAFDLDNRQRIGRVLSELSLGLPVVLTHGPMRILVGAIETMTPALLGEIRTQDAHVAITNRRAQVLKAMVYNGDIARLRLMGGMDHTQVAAIADPSLDLTVPMKGPFQCKRGGDVTLDRMALKLCKLARLLPAAVIVAAPHSTENLVSLDLSDVKGATEQTLDAVAAAAVPLAAAEHSRIHIFRHFSDFEEHYAIEIGQPDRTAPVLCRLHSACFTGDVLGSLKCDCGPQLAAGLDTIAREGAGVLLYLNQEGRGIGLANKLRAYALQAQGFDTVEANHRLGFEDDERDLQIGAQILKHMGFSSTRLMTNNPAKVDRMTSAGIQVVERVPHVYGQNETNANYLNTKAKKSGHLL